MKITECKGCNIPTPHYTISFSNLEYVLIGALSILTVWGYIEFITTIGNWFNLIK